MTPQVNYDKILEELASLIWYLKWRAEIVVVFMDIFYLKGFWTKTLSLGYLSWSNLLFSVSIKYLTLESVFIMQNQDKSWKNTCVLKYLGTLDYGDEICIYRACRLCPHDFFFISMCLESHISFQLKRILYFALWTEHWLSSSLSLVILLKETVS